MQSLTFEQVGVGIATIGVALVLYMNIRKITLEQSDKFALLTETFNRAINDMNLTLTELNATLKFTNKEIETLSNRANKHGGEIDDIRTTQAVNTSTLGRHEDRINKLETKCHTHTNDKDNLK